MVSQNVHPSGRKHRGEQKEKGKEEEEEEGGGRRGSCTKIRQWILSPVHELRAPFQREVCGRLRTRWSGQITYVEAGRIKLRCAHREGPISQEGTGGKVSNWQSPGSPRRKPCPAAGPGRAPPTPTSQAQAALHVHWQVWKTSLISEQAEVGPRLVPHSPGSKVVLVHVSQNICK